MPEAVIPFRDFVIKTGGVLDVAYGDSATIPNTSIVYVEMARKGFKFYDLDTLVEYVGLLSNLTKEDFSVMFPTSKRRYPYQKDVIQDYFTSRDVKKNMQAQQDALDDSDSEQETTGASQDETKVLNKDETTEAVIEMVMSKF